MSTLWQDVRYGWRMLWKRPGFTLLAVAALALGIGANAAIFSVINAALLRPLPFSDPARLVLVSGNFQRLGMTRLGVSAPEFADYKTQRDVFAQTAAFTRQTFNLTSADEAERIAGARVSPELFALLGVAPRVGRTLGDEEAQGGEPHSVVLSHRLWQARFGGNPALIGQSITLDGDSYRVVGVMPPAFQFPFAAGADAERADVWTPLVFNAQELSERSRYNFGMIARLKEGATVEQARAAMSAVGQRLAEQYPRSYRGPRGEDGGWTVSVTPLAEEVVGSARTLLYVLFGVVGCVLLIACANVANLLLARAATRQREVAIRTALGASRGRVVRQFLVESMMLALAGGATGLLLALWGVDLLRAAGPRDIPRLSEAGLDWRVLAFTCAVSLATGMLFGLAPALRSTETDLSEALKEGGRSMTTGFKGQRLRGLLVVSEVALALVLTVGAGLMLKSFRRLLGVAPGFDPERVLTMDLSLSSDSYAQARSKIVFYDQLLERVRALPGVEAASLTSALPLTGAVFGGPFSIENRPLDLSAALPPRAYLRTVTPGYFRVMSIPLKTGRDFDATDTEQSVPVVLINETLARNFFPGGNAMGQRIKIGAPQNPRPWLQIVGVVGDVKSDGLDAAAMPEMYLPFTQNTAPNMTLAVRTPDAPGLLAAPVRRVVQTLDRQQPVFHIRTMRQLLAASIAQRRFNMLLLGAFALVALVLAASGIFGVMSYTVAQRTHEIGVRRALGAQTRDVLRLVIGHGLRLVLVGVGAGLCAAFALSRVLNSLLYDVSATDPATFAAVALLIVAAALLACYLPARRATKVDPMVALRHE
ncbi:MAG TPA: ABC transporter permease [Pyrinomonadaceae bacterium]|jgi:putative ABC transport system permease protein